MLQSLRGTLDSYGIRTLRVETGEDISVASDTREVEFWAVVDSGCLQEIRVAMAAGDRLEATRLLSDRAASLGCILPK